MKDNRIQDVIKRIECMEDSGYRITCIGLKKENDYYITELVHQLKSGIKGWGIPPIKHPAESEGYSLDEEGGRYVEECSPETAYMTVRIYL